MLEFKITEQNTVRVDNSKVVADFTKFIEFKLELPENWQGLTVNGLFYREEDETLGMVENIVSGEVRNLPSAPFKGEEFGQDFKVFISFVGTGADGKTATSSVYELTVQPSGLSGMNVTPEGDEENPFARFLRLVEEERKKAEAAAKTAAADAIEQLQPSIDEIMAAAGSASESAKNAARSENAAAGSAQSAASDAAKAAQDRTDADQAAADAEAAKQAARESAIAAAASQDAAAESEKKTEADAAKTGQDRAAAEQAASDAAAAKETAIQKAEAAEQSRLKAAESEQIATGAAEQSNVQAAAAERSAEAAQAAKKTAEEKARAATQSEQAAANSAAVCVEAGEKVSRAEAAAVRAEQAADSIQEAVDANNAAQAAKAETISAKNATIAASQTAQLEAQKVQQIVAGNEAYTKTESDLKYTVAPRKEASSSTGELKLTDADEGLSYLELQGNSEQYTNTANKNLIDLNFATDGYSISSTGTLDKNEQYFTTGYIVVEPGEQYTFTRAISISNRQGCFYDKDKIFLQPWTGDAGLSKNTVTVPENAKYLRLFDYISHKEASQLEKGNTATDYVPGAVDTPSPEYPSEVRSVGDMPKDVNGMEIRNILDEDTLKNPDNWSVQDKNLYYVKLSPSVAKLFGAGYKISTISFSWQSVLYLSETLTAGANTRITLINNAGVVQSGSYTFPSTDPIYLIAYNRNGDAIEKAQFIDELFKCYKLMLTEAAEIDEYRPYIGENNGLVKIESIGKNLAINSEIIGQATNAGVTVTTNEDQTFNISGTLTADYYNFYQNRLVPLETGETYTITSNLQSSNLNIVMQKVDENSNATGMWATLKNTQNKVTITFDGKNSKGCNIIIQPITQGSSYNERNIYIQIEKGSVQTKYQPGRQQITWIPLKEPLRKMPGTTRYIDQIDKRGNVKVMMANRHFKDLRINAYRPAYGYNDDNYFTMTFVQPSGVDFYDPVVGVGTYPNQDFTPGIALSQMFKHYNDYAARESVLTPGLVSSPHYISLILRYDRFGLTSAATNAEIKEKLVPWLKENDPVIYLGISDGSQFVDLYRYQIPAVYIETHDPETNVRCLNKVKPSDMTLDYKIAMSSLIKRLEALESKTVQEV